MSVSTQARRGGIVVVAVAWLTVALPPVAAAVGQVNFEPTSGDVGDPIVVTGSGWGPPAEGPVQIFLPDQSVTEDEPWLTVPVDEKGSFARDVSIPTLAPGRHTLFACQYCEDDPDGILGARPVLTVDPLPELVPQITLDPETGPPDNTITVTGEGWSVEDGTVLLFADVEDSVDPTLAVGSADPDVDNTISTSIQVPRRPQGDYVFYACQLCDAESPVSDTVDFAITGGDTTVFDPQLVLDPVEGAARQVVLVMGSGWADRRGDVFIYAGKEAMEAGAEHLGTAEVTRGGFAANVPAPDEAPGPATFYACQLCSAEGQLEASASFTIKAVPGVETKLQVTPASARAGDRVTATGSGWRDGEPVSLFLRRSGTSGPGQELARAEVVDEAFTKTLRVPTGIDGSFDVVACQGCGAPGELTRAEAFTILLTLLDPRVAVDPASAEPGEEVSLTGSGWSPAEGRVAIFLEGSGPDGDGSTAWVSIRPRPDGTFARSVVVPDRDAETYVVRACQGCDPGEASREATAGLEITAIPEPTPDYGWLVVAALVLVGLVTARELNRRQRRRRDREKRDAAVKPQVDVYPDDALRVEVQEQPGVPLRLPTLEIVVYEVRADLITQVEVSP